MLGSFKAVTETIKGVSYITNSFNEAYSNAIHEGKLSYSILKNNSFYNKNIYNICAFSLGTVLVNSLLKEAVNNQNNHIIFKNIYLMGGCLDSEDLYNILHILISENSCLVGNIFIINSKNDFVLKNVLKLSSIQIKKPIGLLNFSYSNAADYLLNNNLKVIHFEIDYTKNRNNLKEDLIKVLKKKNNQY